jgi:hypothetical protein
MLSPTVFVTEDVNVHAGNGCMHASISGSYMAVTHRPAPDKCVVTVYHHDPVERGFSTIADLTMHTLGVVGVLFLRLSLHHPTLLVWTALGAVEYEVGGTEVRRWAFPAPFAGWTRLHLMHINHTLLAAFGNMEKLSFQRLDLETGALVDATFAVTVEDAMCHFADTAVSESFDSSHIVVASLFFASRRAAAFRCHSRLLRVNDAGVGREVYRTGDTIADVLELRPDRFLIAVDTHASPSIKIVEDGRTLFTLSLPYMSMSLRGNCFAYLTDKGVLVRSCAHTKLFFIPEIEELL